MYAIPAYIPGSAAMGSPDVVPAGRRVPSASRNCAMHGSMRRIFLPKNELPRRFKERRSGM